MGKRQYKSQHRCTVVYQNITRGACKNLLPNMLLVCCKCLLLMRNVSCCTICVGKKMLEFAGKEMLLTNQCQNILFCEIVINCITISVNSHGAFSI